MLALSIRQPFAELILRGIKTAEYRTVGTNIIGERFFIYAPLKRAQADIRVWSRDLAMPDDRLPDFLIELAEQMKLIPPDELFPKPVDGRDRLSGDVSFSVDEHDAVDQLLQSLAPVQFPPA